MDLTDNQLVGLRWTALGDFSAGRPTQELVQLEEIFDEYCNTINSLEQDGWRLDYVLTGSTACASPTSPLTVRRSWTAPKWSTST
ncbi:MAG: hypothetical protein R3A10_18070 [Caldilineaceae bacterium]